MSEPHQLPALNKVCKWRSVLTGWIFGTRMMNSPGTKGARDLMDKLTVLRVENSALAALLIKKKVFTAEEYTAIIEREAALLDEIYELSFPGFRSFANGLEIYDVKLANETMARLGFPE